MTGLKRFSQQLPKVTPTPPIKAPLSARDSYFPSSIGNDVHRVWAGQGSSNPPVVPVSPHGLGMGLPPSNTSFRRAEGKAEGVLFDESSMDKNPQVKGKRKPVPKMDDSLDKKMDGLKVQDTHAL